MQPGSYGDGRTIAPFSSPEAAWSLAPLLAARAISCVRAALVTGHMSLAIYILGALGRDSKYLSQQLIVPFCRNPGSSLCFYLDPDDKAKVQTVLLDRQGAAHPAIDLGHLRQIR